MYLKHWLAFDVTQAFDIDKGGVQKVACRGRDHGQRIVAGGTGHLKVRHMVRQAIQALGCQACAEELAFARRCGKTAGCERGIGQGQRGKAFVQQFIEVHLVTIHCPAQGLVAV